MITVEERLVVETLRLGDHLATTKPRTRGVVGLALIALAGIGPRRMARKTINADLLFVLANPVEHGARLAESVISALARHDVRVCLVADERLAVAGLAVGSNFPGLSPFSLARHVPRKAFLRALAALRRVSVWPVELQAVPLIYRSYLFVAQYVRFILAESRSQDWQGGVVLTDFDRHAYSAPLVGAALSRGVSTITLVHGTPTRENYLPLRAEHVLAWGSVQKQFFGRHAAAASVHVVGRPDLPERLGPAAGRRLVLCHSLEELSPSEERRLHAVVEASRAEGVPSVVRAHPRDPALRHGGGWRELADAVDAVVPSDEALHEFLTVEDVVIGVSSTALVDAVALGCPALVVADASRPLSCDLAHLRRITNTESGPLTSDFDEGAMADLGRDIVVATGADAQERLAGAIRSLIARAKESRGGAT